MAEGMESLGDAGKRRKLFTRQVRLTG